MTVDTPTLSYVLTTRNRLPMLRVTLARLIENRRDDEEIVVADGASTDGTTEYLHELAAAGAIDEVISAPDHGEAHGLNRGFLRACGELIKVVSDDDAYYWPGVKACREFMLDHPGIDVLGSNGGATNPELDEKFGVGEFQDWFLRWRDDHRSFQFCGLGIMVRRSSLPLVGLFNPAFVRVDMEFALRVTQGPARLAWHLGYDWLRIGHDQSSGVVQLRRLAHEARYEAVHAGTDTVEPHSVNLTARRLRARAGDLRRSLRRGAAPPAGPERQILRTSDGIDAWLETFACAERWLAEANQKPLGFLS